MRSVLLIVLLLAVAMGQFGTIGLVLVRHQRGRRRTEVLRTRRRNEEQGGLTHLVVPPQSASSQWVRVGRDEVRYEGHLYDVVFEEHHGDTLHLWVHWDEQEEAAMTRLAQAFGKMAQAAGIAPVMPHLKNLHLFYLSVSPAVMHPPCLGKMRYVFQQARTTAAPFDEVLHPPPRV